MNIENAVHERLINNKLTLSVAESCTGGLVSARLTSMPGSSGYFLGSVVVYSNALKTKLLAIDEEFIALHGAVSEHVVTSMLEGVLHLTGSDYGIAVSGIAGPDGGSAEKPVGTVWCAVGDRFGNRRVWLLQAKGNREMIVERSVNALLVELLAQVLLREDPVG